MPPAALKPAGLPHSRIASSMTWAAPGVALTRTLPVEVLRKSAPSSRAMREAAAIAVSVSSSPVSRITLSSRSGGSSALERRTSSAGVSWSPASRARHGSTTSTSSAPAASASSMVRRARSDVGRAGGKVGDRRNPDRRRRPSRERPGDPSADRRRGRRPCHGVSRRGAPDRRSPARRNLHRDW